MLPQSMFPVVANPECECPPRIVAYEGAPNDGDILVYDETTDTWGPAAPNPGDITAVNTTLPLTGGAASGSVTLDINNFTGDAGAGGLKGTVPAPAAGDAAAGKFLSADGTWAAPPAGGLTLLTEVRDPLSPDTSSLTYVDLITTGVIATSGGTIRLELQTDVVTDGASAANSRGAAFRFLVDGLSVNGEISVVTGSAGTPVYGRTPVSISAIVQGLPAGNHEFKAQFKSEFGGLIYVNEYAALGGVYLRAYEF